MAQNFLPQTVQLLDNEGIVRIIDQTLLPGRLQLLDLKTKEQVWEAIYKLRVRGAPAIGLAAACGLYICAKNIQANNYNDFYKEFKELKDYLATSRPTAVHLFWALNRMDDCAKKNNNKSVAEIKEALLEECQSIEQDDVNVSKAMAKNGLSLINKNKKTGILTHCNTGHLATVRYGSVLGSMYMAKEQGYDFHVYVDETRPLLQGARLTAFELQAEGVDFTLICDNMASIVMQNKWVDMVFVGSDRVVANGDTANKVGTSGLAILAKYYGIPFYVFTRTAGIDMSKNTGADINIEERPGEEITSMWFKEPIAPKGIKTYNPAFDVTDNSLITGIVTEHGVLKPPYSSSIKALFKKE
jgi:methylthioribose-1-phosphate isomerase